MRDRLPLLLSATALVVSVLGATPLGHAAYNAVVPNNSVGALQLRNGAVTNAKLRGDAVTSGKVLNGSLKAVDFKAGQLPAGAKGDKGDKGNKGDKGLKGDKGAKGDPGLSGYELIRKSTTAPANSSPRVQTICPTGKKVIGGSSGVQGVPNGMSIHTQINEDNFIADLANTGTATRQRNAVAICATVTP
jgi:hypothetical protein